MSALLASLDNMGKQLLSDNPLLSTNPPQYLPSSVVSLPPLPKPLHSFVHPLPSLDAAFSLLHRRIRATYPLPPLLQQYCKPDTLAGLNEYRYGTVIGYDAYNKRHRIRWDAEAESNRFRLQLDDVLFPPSVNLDNFDFEVGVTVDEVNKGNELYEGNDIMKTNESAETSTSTTTTTSHSSAPRGGLFDPSLYPCSSPEQRASYISAHKWSTNKKRLYNLTALHDPILPCYDFVTSLNKTVQKRPSAARTTASATFGKVLLTYKDATGKEFLKIKRLVIPQLTNFGSDPNHHGEQEIFLYQNQTSSQPALKDAPSPSGKDGNIIDVPTCPEILTVANSITERTDASTTLVTPTTNASNKHHYSWLSFSTKSNPTAQDLASQNPPNAALLLSHSYSSVTHTYSPFPLRNHLKHAIQQKRFCHRCRRVPPTSATALQCCMATACGNYFCSKCLEHLPVGMAGVAMPCCNGTCDCVLCNVVQKRLIESQSLISSAKRLCLEIAPPEKEANRLCAEKMKGHARLGSKIKVYWPDDKKWYRGKVGDVFNAEKKVEVQYDDGDVEWLDMRTQIWEYRTLQPQSFLLADPSIPNLSTPHPVSADDKALSETLLLDLQQRCTSCCLRISHGSFKSCATCLRKIHSTCASFETISTVDTDWTDHPDMYQCYKCHMRNKVTLEDFSSVLNPANVAILARNKTGDARSLSKSLIETVLQAPSFTSFCLPRSVYEMPTSRTELLGCSSPPATFSDDDSCCSENERDTVDCIDVEFRRPGFKIKHRKFENQEGTYVGMSNGTGAGGWIRAKFGAEEVNLRSKECFLVGFIEDCLQEPEEKATEEEPEKEKVEKKEVKEGTKERLTSPSGFQIDESVSPMHDSVDYFAIDSFAITELASEEQQQELKRSDEDYACPYCSRVIPIARQRAQHIRFCERKSKSKPKETAKKVLAKQKAATPATPPIMNSLLIPEVELPFDDSDDDDAPLASLSYALPGEARSIGELSMEQRVDLLCYTGNNVSRVGLLTGKKQGGYAIVTFEDGATTTTRVARVFVAKSDPAKMARIKQKMLQQAKQEAGGASTQQAALHAPLRKKMLQQAKQEAGSASTQQAALHAPRNWHAGSTHNGKIARKKICPPTCCPISDIPEQSRVGQHVFCPSVPYESGLVVKSGNRITVLIGPDKYDMKLDQVMVMVDQKAVKGELGQAPAPPRPASGGRKKKRAEWEEGEEEASEIEEEAEEEEERVVVVKKVVEKVVDEKVVEKKVKKKSKKNEEGTCSRCIAYDPYAKQQQYAKRQSKTKRTMKQEGEGEGEGEKKLPQGYVNSNTSDAFEVAQARLQTGLITEKTKNKAAVQGRSARADSRRVRKNSNVMGMGFDSLKCREPKLRFARSGIHGWGVFADETIKAEEMVIEYRGELINNNVADKREMEYEEQKIGSDYMFRIDDEVVCDATKKGALARYINTSCDPSCYTKIIKEGVMREKKIVIYAMRDIAPGEELSYDYKFAIEEDGADKLICYCGAEHCRGYMN